VEPLLSLPRVDDGGDGACVVDRAPPALVVDIAPRD